MHPRLSPYPDLAATLNTLQQEAQRILSQQFTALYLTGSLALGDFNPQTSDIDFVVVTSDEALQESAVSALSALHQRLAQQPSKWGYELEGSYVPQRALCHYDPHDALYPYVARGGLLNVEQHDSAWLIQCDILYHHGVTLAGPPPQMFLQPLTAQDLRRAVLDLLWWWEQQLEDTSLIVQPAYQAYAILTMCRILNTMQHGAIVSKPTAARWAQAQLPAPWRDLIARAQSWQPGSALDALPETLAFIRYTLERVR